MEPNLAEVAKRDLMRRWQSVFPYLEEANLRLISRYLEEAKTRHIYPEIPGLENYSDEGRDRFRELFFKPFASPEEKIIMILADLVVALFFPEKIISGIVFKAVPEIEEAYRVILQEGGGWSSSTHEAGEKRKTAALEWCRRNQARLSYLKKTHLEEKTLYYGGTGQEKRNFFSRLLLTIINEVTHKKLTSRKVMDLLKGKTSRS